MAAPVTEPDPKGRRRRLRLYSLCAFLAALCFFAALLLSRGSQIWLLVAGACNLIGGWIGVFKARRLAAECDPGAGPQ